ASAELLEMTKLTAYPWIEQTLPIVSRHKRKLVSLFLAIIGLTLIVTMLMPNTYRSQARLFLRLGRENVTLDPTATLGQTPVVAVPQSRENEVNSVLDLLKRPVLLERVVAKLGPATILGRAPLTAAVAGDPQEAAPNSTPHSPWTDAPLPG